VNAKMLVRSSKVDIRPYKSGPREFILLNLLDMSNPPMENTIDFELTDAQKGQFPIHTLDGKTIEVAITIAETAFGGRLRCRGEIVSNGEPAKK